ncbi:MAG: GntR family transcriptional regulator [Lentisphaeria bacterium]|nr:GntR family transcriptional regulator [Lentisphaeria bacterium]
MDLVSKSQFIADSLLEKIRSKQLSGRIPSDKKIAEEYHVALMTAVRALKILERKGCVIRIPRKGTFTAEIQPKILKIFCNNNPTPFFGALQELVHQWDPGYQLVQMRNPQEADLIQWTTFSSLLNWHVNALPFSKERENRLRRQKHLWEIMFDLHFRNGQLFGVPYLFSPILLNYNRTMMRELEKDFSPADLTMEHFIELLRKASEHGYCGLDFSSFGVGFFLSAAHTLAMGNPGIESLLGAARYMKEIVKYSGGNFAEGKTLFVLEPRHNFFHDRFSDYDIAPLPSINGIRCTSAASETLAVTARATDPERLHELCELTLSPEFQQKVTQNKFGIAMDRGVAVNSMDTSARRDDFYFSEVKNIRFSHYDYELDTLQEIALLVTDFQKNVIGCAAFEKGLRKAIQLQIRAENRRRRFSLLNGETDDIRKIVN